VDYSRSNAGVTVSLLAGNVGSGGHAQGDRLAQIEHVIGSDFGDYITGADDALIGNTLLGRDGNDTLRGMQGADSMVGGTGQDYLSYLGSNAGVFVRLATREANGGHATGDWYTGIEHVLGSGQADTLGGDSGNNTLFGDVGPDTLLGDTGADSLIGGVGSDTLDYQLSNEAVTINLGDNDVEHGGHAEGDFVTLAEHIGGSQFDDTLTGNNELNFFLAATGNDTLFGASGNDSINGGQGDDYLHDRPGQLSPIVSWAAAGANDVVELAYTRVGGGLLRQPGQTGQRLQRREASGRLPDISVEHLIGGSLRRRPLIGLDGQFELPARRRPATIQPAMAASGADCAVRRGWRRRRLQFDSADSAVIGGAGIDTLLGTGGCRPGADERRALHLRRPARRHRGLRPRRRQRLLPGLHHGGALQPAGHQRRHGLRRLRQRLPQHARQRRGRRHQRLRRRRRRQRPVIWGGAGNDTFVGGDGGDNTYGGFGNDTLFGRQPASTSTTSAATRATTRLRRRRFRWPGAVLGQRRAAQRPGLRRRRSERDRHRLWRLDRHHHLRHRRQRHLQQGRHARSSTSSTTATAMPATAARRRRPTCATSGAASWDAGSQTFSAFTLAVDG
jgi:Ca2+-binding RTX toxin-like protein